MLWGNGIWLNCLNGMRIVNFGQNSVKINCLQNQEETEKLSKIPTYKLI